MMQTTRPLFFISLALIATICHQAFSFELPIPTRLEQCVAKGYSRTCDYIHPETTVEYVCSRLYCGETEATWPHGHKLPVRKIVQSPPVDGTRCGPFSYCLNGKCIRSKKESEKLQYTGPETVQGCQQ